MANRRRVRLLVVEDDELMAAFYDSILAPHSGEFAFSIATTGAAALRRVKAAPVDLAILDWDLPDVTGVAMLKALRRSGSKVIVVTGRASPKDRLFALENGAHDFLNKPFEPEELLARLRNLSAP